jgi:hypothetical protein
MVNGQAAAWPGRGAGRNLSRQAFRANGFWPGAVVCANGEGAGPPFFFLFLSAFGFFFSFVGRI